MIVSPLGIIYIFRQGSRNSLVYFIMYKTQFKEDGFISEETDIEMSCIFIFVPCESVQFL